MRKSKISLFSLRHEKPGTRIGDHTLETCSKCQDSGVINDFFGKTVIYHGVFGVPNEEDGAIELQDDVCLTTKD